MFIHIYNFSSNITLSNSKHKPDLNNLEELWFLEIKACYKVLFLFFNTIIFIFIK